MKRLGAVAVVFVWGQAAADPVDTLSEAAMRSQAGDHAGAIALYERAYHADFDVELLPILATEYRLAGRLDEAVQDYCAYLAIAPGGRSAANVERALHGLETPHGMTSCI